MYTVLVIRFCDYLGHLDHVGELSKAGNGNHIMVRFYFCAERQANDKF